MKIAIVQDGPHYLDAINTLDKTEQYVKKAKADNADLIVFGENWFSGYPVWLDICKDANLWDHEPVKEVWAKTFRSGLEVGSKQFKDLQKIIASNALYVIMGANEPVSTGPGNGTIYNSIFTFDPAGQLINHHRKLMPTYTEKLVHGLGDGAGLNTLATPFGRIGSLICWEHWMPLTRQAMHDQGEDVHIALWPYVKEMHQVACRHYAHEGRCFVIAVGQVMHKTELPCELVISDQIQLDNGGLLLRGGSAVYGPDGSIVLKPVYNKKDLILVEIDVTAALKEQMNLSVSGHYQRPDVFNLKVDKSRSY